MKNAHMHTPQISTRYLHSHRCVMSQTIQLLVAQLFVWFQMTLLPPPHSNAQVITHFPEQTSGLCQGKVLYSLDHLYIT